jgi:hypothetical protein
MMLKCAHHIDFHKMSEYGNKTDNAARPDILPKIHFVYFLFL